MARGTFFFFSSLAHCSNAHLYLWTEHRNKTITRIFGGNARYGCYFLAFMIFSFGILRDQLYVFFNTKCLFFSPEVYIRYHHALLDQPQKALLSEEYRIIVPAALFITGQTFVITSTWALGITGTFLGDYFGILMDHRVEGYVSSRPFCKILKSIHSSFY
jgi:phosphatidylethanolamine/phosphatidyl-N-methylethanolamine N-methyltransferase